MIVPDFRGQQALNAWLAGHDAGVLLQGPDPDSPHPVMNGVVVAQEPRPGTRVARWEPVTVWIRHDPDDGSGVREPSDPVPPLRALKAERGDLPESNG
ncbi:PASTA domain-containing protein [Sphaerisporangium dianthi]|uniref:PASTA domain-containing protein n=1 Tax=Sphaerisporangium dianthi TaxID=1436120 RepID=A0ABV9CA66_9ACTN